jgi:hypothetical protein
MMRYESGLIAWIRKSHGSTFLRRYQGARNLPASALALLLVAIVAASSCADTADNDEMVLDLDTLEAETEFGTLEAWRLDDTFVGPLDEGQAIGVARLDDVEGGGPGEVVVYLYDRQSLAVLIGEVDEDGVGTFQSGELADFDATVDLVIDDDVASGTASFLQQSTPFTASAATGLGGVYWAEGTDENPDVSADWVVLPDERQWGCICLPPGFSPCCQMQR